MSGNKYADEKAARERGRLLVVPMTFQQLDRYVRLLKALPEQDRTDGDRKTITQIQDVLLAALFK